MTGTNLHLRAVEPSDVDLLYDWENNEKLWHISNTIEPFSRFAIEQYVMNADADIYAKKQLRLMIELKQPPQTIGHVDLFDFDPRNLRAGIGIMIMDEYQNKGHASEALELVIQYGFEQLGLHQLYCNITADNENSKKLFERQGFRQTGIKKEWIRKNNHWLDEAFYQLLKDSAGH